MHYPCYVLQKIIGMYYRDAIMAMLAWLALSPEVSGSNSAAADALWYKYIYQYTLPYKAKRQWYSLALQMSIVTLLFFSNTMENDNRNVIGQ